jgi:hypothetical protein
MKVIDDLLAEQRLEWTPAQQPESAKGPSVFVLNSKRRIIIER